MSLFGKLFGSEKALGGIVDGVTKGLDALVYTDEEKEQAASADRSEARKMVVQWMTATQGQNLSRRLIALSITAMWLFQMVAAQILAIFSIWVSSVAADGDISTRAKLVEASSIMQNGADDMSSAVMLILAFYFAAPHMGDVAQAVLGKFKNKIK